MIHYLGSKNQSYSKEVKKGLSPLHVQFTRSQRKFYLLSVSETFLNCILLLTLYFRFVLSLDGRGVYVDEDSNINDKCQTEEVIVKF